jgi:hypothetical protein
MLHCHGGDGIRQYRRQPIIVEIRDGLLVGQEGELAGVLFEKDLNEMGHKIPPRALFVLVVKVREEARISDLGI